MSHSIEVGESPLVEAPIKKGLGSRKQVRLLQGERNANESCVLCYFPEALDKELNRVFGGKMTKLQGTLTQWLHVEDDQ